MTLKEREIIARLARKRVDCELLHFQRRKREATTAEDA
jgi:hypothetical protein